jgi:hypothetical protein
MVRDRASTGGQETMIIVIDLVREYWRLVHAPSMYWITRRARKKSAAVDYCGPHTELLAPLRRFRITWENPMSTCTPTTDAAITVMNWLRQPNRNPLFLNGDSGVASQLREAIVSRFLSWLQPAGFTLTAVNEGTENEPRWACHWLYRGNQFVGFRQPDYVEKRVDALLVACAALLENEWCRSRL